MIKQYLKTGWRNLYKNKIFSLINITGLALGMFCVIIILQWINYETGFNKFHDNYKNLYRVVNNWGDEKDVSCPGALARYLKDKYPEVENASTYSVSSNIKLTYQNESFLTTGGLADSTFFNMFSFPILNGDIENIFPAPNSAVITRDMAEKLFGKEDPIGKLVKMEFEDMQINMSISGIIENIPENSSLQFDFLVSSAIAPQGYFIWTNNWPDIFVQLKKTSSYNELSQKIANSAKVHDQEATNTFELKPFAHEHLYALNGSGLINYIRIFGLVAIIVLIIACFNYINLSTAQITKRQKEIGIKKVLGSSKAIIQKQFMFEVAIISVIGFILAFSGVKLFLPFLNNLIGKNISFELTPVIFFSLFGAITVTTIISGIYPSFYIASLKPVLILNNKAGVEQGRKISLRNILVVSQFAFTFILIISLIGIYKQLQYIHNKDLGYTRDGIVLVSLQGETQDQCELIKEELLKNPNIVNATGSSFHPVMQDGETSFVKWKGMSEDKKVSTKFNYVDCDYLNTFNIGMKEGRFFSKDFADNSSYQFIVNEELIKNMGIKQPIGRQIALFGDKYGTIIGVMKNFHNESLHDKIREYSLMLGKSFNYLSVKVKPQNISETIDYIGKKLKNIEPSLLFSYSFLDKEIERKYFRDKLIGKLTVLFALLSVFISFLGLFGLVLFTINQHTKEIGIRKVNGATIKDILIRLNMHFIKWIGLSFLLAVPVSIFIISEWFSNFTYKTTVSWWIFIIAGISILFLSLIVVSLQSWNAACMNPVETLKYE